MTILHRLEGTPALPDTALDYPFSDVAADSWYGTAVYWARANGIVNGVSDTAFAPNQALTREQMAAILYRYAEYKGADLSASADLSGYTGRRPDWPPMPKLPWPGAPAPASSPVPLTSPSAPGAPPLGHRWPPFFSV